MHNLFRYLDIFPKTKLNKYLDEHKLYDKIYDRIAYDFCHRNLIRGDKTE